MLTTIYFYLMMMFSSTETMEDNSALGQYSNLSVSPNSPGGGCPGGVCIHDD